MGLLSSSLSVTRYHIDGTVDGPVNETVKEGLTRYAIPDMETGYDEVTVGWAPYESPYDPDFDRFPILFGTFFVFSLRVDKKSVPVKLVQKHMALESRKIIKNSGRDFLSRHEKKALKERVLDMLITQAPAIPNIFDVLWIQEEKICYFITTQRSANEFFETLFLKSFGLKPVSLFPYTIIEKISGFDAPGKDRILSSPPLTYSRNSHA